MISQKSKNIGLAVRFYISNPYLIPCTCFCNILISDLNLFKLSKKSAKGETLAFVYRQLLSILSGLSERTYTYTLDLV